MSKNLYREMAAGYDDRQNKSIMLDAAPEGYGAERLRGIDYLAKQRAENGRCRAGFFGKEGMR